MATRTSRRSGVPQGTPAKSHTPTVATPTRQRPPSPLSPTRQSRVDEKFQMQNLNDRLASYIDEVRKRDIEIGNYEIVHVLLFLSIRYVWLFFLSYMIR